jgi:hypothetical protein
MVKKSNNFSKTFKTVQKGLKKTKWFESFKMVKKFEESKKLKRYISAQFDNKDFFLKVQNFKMAKKFKFYLVPQKDQNSTMSIFFLKFRMVEKRKRLEEVSCTTWAFPQRQDFEVSWCCWTLKQMLCCMRGTPADRANVIGGGANSSLV